MTVQCIQCAKASLQDAPIGMAKQNFARCPTKLPSEFVSILYERDCADFSEAAAGVVTKRSEWVKNQRRAA
jgi:hypothetical protein